MKNLYKHKIQFIVWTMSLFIFTACNYSNMLNQDPQIETITSGPVVALTKIINPTPSVELSSNVNPWNPGQELFPGEYIQLPEQEFLPIEVDKIPQRVTTAKCEFGCLDMVRLFPAYWGQDNYSSSLPYQYWSEMGKKYSNQPFKAKINFSLGLASRGDVNLQSKFAGYDQEINYNPTPFINDLGIDIPGKNHTEENVNNGLLLNGWSQIFQNEPTPFKDQYSVLVNWETVEADNKNIDWSNYAVQLKGICLDFYLKPNEQFFHRACQPILRNPKEGRFTIGVDLPAEVNSVWVAVRPFDEDKSSSFDNVYQSDDIYGVWFVNLQNVTPTSMGSIDETCKHINCLATGSFSTDGYHPNAYPIPAMCPGDTFMGSTFGNPEKKNIKEYSNNPFSGNNDLWSDWTRNEPTYMINFNSINLFPELIDNNHVSSFNFSNPLISKNDKNLIQGNIEQNQFAYDAQRDKTYLYGMVMESSGNNIDIKNGKQFLSYHLPNHTYSGPEGFNVYVAWRYQCSK